MGCNGKVVIGVLYLLISWSLLGCGAEKVLYEEKEECELIVSDNVTIVYNDNEYVVLSEKVSKEDVGTWVGYINKNVSGAMFSTVYLDEKYDEMINVAIDDCFYRAVEKDGLETKQKRLQLSDFEGDEMEIVNSICLNPNDATQLIGNDKIYQVTNEIVSKEELATYKTSLSVYVVFDMNTKKIIEKEEYTKIDWKEENDSNENRAVWVYKDVYSIKNVSQESIAVNVNGEYHIANVLK